MALSLNAEARNYGKRNLLTAKQRPMRELLYSQNAGGSREAQDFNEN